MSERGDKPRVWLVRAGRHGEDEQTALEQGLAIVGFSEIGDLVQFKSISDITNELRQNAPSWKVAAAENRARQLRAFRDGIRAGDIIVLPLKSQAGRIALGRATGPYKYLEVNSEMRHTRKVEWIRSDIPRSTFQQDLLYSFGAFMTVCQIKRHEADTRVVKVLSGEEDPGYGEEPEGGSGRDGELPLVQDIEQAAHDEISAFIRDNFRGHDMPRLVEAILKAEGFLTHRSTPGPDGGADILAASGPLGLDAPTLCVQVKATEAAADVTVFRALQGTMTTFGASQGLLVCWGGFTQAVKTEARQHTFTIRLWEESDVVQALYRVYDRLPEEIQAELPLKRVWMLVREELE